VALDEHGDLVGKGDLRAQTVQSLRNMEKVLDALGATWSDVIRYTWYVLDATQAQTIRDVRDSFVRPVLGDLPNPASTLMQVVSLYSPDILVEVEAVVALP
jgi:enamine deaminase RidA (YjgF/YER057c/UK114 family)